MTRARQLARNVALNLFGQLAPLIVAVIAVPPLIAALGPDRFGILTLAWALIGYFGLFDFGVGRALTQMASEAIGLGDEARLRGVSVFALTVLFALGLFGAVTMAAATPWLCYRVLNMPASMRSEAATSFFLLAASLPFVLSTIGLRGLMEAHQHFGVATALRLPYSLFNFVGPLLILPFSRSLVPIVAALVVGRVLTFVAHLWVSLRRYPWLRQRRLGANSFAQPLFRLGGWITISNVVSPVMVYMDRFFIAALISTSAVAFYVTPYEVITKLLFVPAAVLGVFFPAFASTFVQDRARTAAMFDRTVRCILAVMFPLTVLAVGVGPEAMSIWVGAEFARQSIVVLQILAVGVLINSFAQIPVGLLQAIGRADLTAKAHLAELPAYILALFTLAKFFGVAGVAAAWSLRVAVDAALQCWLARSQLRETGRSIRHSMLWLIGMVLVLVLLAAPSGTLLRVGLVALVLLSFVTITWRVRLTAEERAEIVSWFGRRRPWNEPRANIGLTPTELPSGE
jgi:O-antigen/teichoic acid export membrane protein